MRQLIRLAVVLGMLTTMLVSGAAAGRADVVQPGIDGTKAGISVRVHGGNRGGGGGGGPSCSWRPAIGEDFYNAVHLGSPIIHVPPRTLDPPPPVQPWTYAPLTPVGEEPGSGTWFLSFCGDDITYHWIRLGVAQPAVPVQDLIDAALAYLEPPKPRMGVSPEDDLVVNVPTWLWVNPADWNSVTSVTASAGDGVPQIYQEATVTARAQSLNFTMGDGGSTPGCQGPGVRWTTAYDAEARSPSRCDYVYQRARNRYTITANIVWRIEWSAQGVAVNQGPTFLGTITTRSTVNRRVVEVQTIN
jgi:hypothetical protein